MTENQIRDSFQSLVESADCMMAVVREDRSIAYFNPFAEQLTGYSSEEVLERSFVDIFQPVAEKTNSSSVLKWDFNTEPTKISRQMAICRHDGSIRWLQYDIKKIDDFAGQPGHLILGHDITEQKLLTDDLQRQAARLRAILETAVDGIIAINEQGTIQSVNPATERIFGYSAEEMNGKNINMLMPSPYRQEHDDYLTNYLTTGEKKIIGIGREVEAKRKDGSIFPCAIAVSEALLSDQRLFTGMVRDITEQKKTQDSLIEREMFLQTIFDTEPACVCILGPGGILLRMNRAGLNMIEAETPGHVESKCIFPIIVSEYREAFEALIDFVFEGNSGTLEFEIIGRKGTQRRLEIHGVPLRDPQGEITAFLGIARDISEQKLAETRALQAERLAAIGETVTGLAHESRNAFQRSQACLEILELELEDQPDQLELVKRTQRALSHLHRLYEEVRDYAAPINLDRQSCDLMHLWRDAWAHLEVNRKEKKVELRESGSEMNLSCNADWFAMGQVFRNILENAITACQEPGVIEICWQECEFDGKAALKISIKDNGAGIAPADRDQVFNAFFTTKTKGTGLGMAIARRIVESHGGQIIIGNSASGAEFIITIPRA